MRGFDEAVIDPRSTSDRRQFPAMLASLIYAQEGLEAQFRRGLSVNAHERLALVHLWAAGPMTMSELGERIPLSRAAITTLTDRLERMGYVRRTSDETDRRRTMLVLTERPYEIVSPLFRPYADALRSFAEGLDPAQWQFLTDFVRSMREISTSISDVYRAMSDDDISAVVDNAARARRTQKNG
jgi:DNA-binding MarR family transcriptional regulator